MMESKLNVGCGPVSVKGWDSCDWGILPLLSQPPFILFRKILIHLGILSTEYDLSWPKLDLVDIRKKLPYMDGSYNYIYCSHVLEHLEPFEALKALREMKRILKPKGFLRLVVPDIDKMVKMYTKNKKSKIKKVANKFCQMWWGIPKDQMDGSFGCRIKLAFTREHKWHYSVEEMTALVHRAGFKRKNIFVCGFRKGKVPDLEKLDLKEHKNHSLYMECKNS